jgi:hypothetical protein
VVNLIRLKAAKIARKVVDNFYTKVLGKPRLKMDSATNLNSKELEKKFPYLKAYSTD